MSLILSRTLIRLARAFNCTLSVRLEASVRLVAKAVRMLAGYRWVSLRPSSGLVASPAFSDAVWLSWSMATSANLSLRLKVI